MITTPVRRRARTGLRMPPRHRNPIPAGRAAPSAASMAASDLAIAYGRGGYGGGRPHQSEEHHIATEALTTPPAATELQRHPPAPNVVARRDFPAVCLVCSGMGKAEHRQDTRQFRSSARYRPTA
jgi:hypothetical protein